MGWLSDAWDDFQSNVLDDALGIEGDIAQSVKEGIKGAEDWVLDDALGLRDLDTRITDNILGWTDEAATNREKRDQANAIRNAQMARDLPTQLANAALAARRRRMRSMSLMASGSATGASGGAPLSNVMATGLSRLGA